MQAHLVFKYSTPPPPSSALDPEKSGVFCHLISITAETLAPLLINFQNTPYNPTFCPWLALLRNWYKISYLKGTVTRAFKPLFILSQNFSISRRFLSVTFARIEKHPGYKSIRLHLCTIQNVSKISFEPFLLQLQVGRTITLTHSSNALAEFCWKGLTAFTVSIWLLTWPQDKFLR